MDVPAVSIFDARRICVLIALISAVTFIPAANGEDLTLRDAIQQAMSGNPYVLAAEARVDEARGQRLQAGLSPNPRLAVQTEDVRFWGPAPYSFGNSTEDYGYVGQVLETAGKRERRVETAGAIVEMNDAERRRVERSTEFNVAGAYWSAVAAFKVRDLLKQDLGTYEEDVIYSRNRFQQGVMAEADLLRTELERDRVQQEVLSATRDADQSAVDLYRAMGKIPPQEVKLADGLETVPVAKMPDVQAAQALRPEYAAAEAAVRQAESNLRLQKADAKPDPEAFFGYKRDVGLDTLYAAVQIDLPFRNRNQGNIAAAVAQVQSAKESLRALDISIRDELAAAMKVYQDQRELLASLPATRDRADEIARVTRAAYREGAVDLLRLLDAERSRIDVQVSYYRALAQIQQAVLNLKLAAGADPIDGLNPQ